MIPFSTTVENTNSQLVAAIHDLQIAKLLRKSNIRKAMGIPAFEVFQFLLLLVFQGKNLFRFLHSKHKAQAVSKNTYYHFLDNSACNWGRFLLLLAAKVIATFDRLTNQKQHVCPIPFGKTT